MNRNLLRMARRALGKPPAYVARRALQELQAEAERFFGPRRARSFQARQLLARTGANSIAELWERLAARPYVAEVKPMAREDYEALCPGDTDRILRAAERALAHRVDLLGSGDIHLGDEIDWHKDYKSGFRWPPQYCRDIDYMNPGRPSDVKFPWELSRQQWLIPCGQAWLLTGEERWAAGARRIVESWIDANPYAGSVNWSCTMEAAIRILTWTWLFHACSRSAAWSEEDFQTRFLSSLYLHADFTDRHIEYADVNGNHCDADAAGLVFAGLFFAGATDAQRWLERGWKILCDELPRQVSEDGVDFEGSVPYHRLVSELFFLPALYRLRCSLDVPDAYKERVTKMGWFTEAYTRPDGSAPVWGDADDARALCFANDRINDHRYLLEWIGLAFGEKDLRKCFGDSLVESVWLLGLNAAAMLSDLSDRGQRSTPQSVLFPHGGYAALRSTTDHVFVDCGPVGTAGRGGHGHNDVLSFELFLQGELLVVDCGAFVYTADYTARNAFRSTAYHNTPIVDGQEINRFTRHDDLWWLQYDAIPRIRRFELGLNGRDTLTLSHSGYRRLNHPVEVVRTFVLDRVAHRLTVDTSFEGQGSHDFEVPFHLTGATTPVLTDETVIPMGRCRCVIASEQVWVRHLERAAISPSYGVLEPGERLVFRTRGISPRLTVTFEQNN